MAASALMVLGTSRATPSWTPELQQQRAMGVILPPIFLLVSAFPRQHHPVAPRRAGANRSGAQGRSATARWRSAGTISNSPSPSPSPERPPAGRGAVGWGTASPASAAASSTFRFLIFHIDASVYVGAVAVTLLAAIAGAASARARRRPPARRGRDASAGAARLSPSRPCQHSGADVAEHGDDPAPHRALAVTRDPHRVRHFDVGGGADRGAVLAGRDRASHRLLVLPCRPDGCGGRLCRRASGVGAGRRRPPARNPSPWSRCAMSPCGCRTAPISARGLAGRTPDADLSRIIDTDGRTVVPRPASSSPTRWPGFRRQGRRHRRSRRWRAAGGSRTCQ